MQLALGLALLAGVLWWYPAAAFAMSLAIPVAAAAKAKAVLLFFCGAASAFGSAYAYGRARDRRPLMGAVLPLAALTGLLGAHVAGARLVDLGTNLDPFGGAHAAHDSCAPAVATALTVLKTAHEAKKGSPYIDVVLDVEASMALEVSPAGEARDERSNARFPMEVEPARLAPGKGRLTLRLMDADGRRRDGLSFSNLAVYLRSPDCPAQPRAVLVPRLTL